MKSLNVGSLLNSALAAALVIGIAQASPAAADPIDFGGPDLKFKGAGDKEPPKCQVDLPTTASEPFFVKWDCNDNGADPKDIRSELWIFRKDAPAGQVIGTFLGFPASVYVDAAVLQSATFAEGLPVSFRLRATDLAGITATTELLSVFSQDNRARSCSLNIVSEGDSSSSAGTVALSDVDVTSVQNSDTNVVISTSEAREADPCTLTSVCSEGGAVGFQADLTFDSANAVTGTLTVTPGASSIEVTGTATKDSGELDSFEVSGTTTIDGQTADVSLSCSGS